MGDLAYLEGEGEADDVKAQQLDPVQDYTKVLGECSGSLPQPSHHGGCGLKAKPVAGPHSLLSQKSMQGL